MRVETQQSFHFGVNYVLAPLPRMDGGKLREFHSKLAEAGLEFEHTAAKKNDLRLEKGPPAPLNVRVAQVGPRVGQLLMVAPRPERPLHLFEEEAGIICAAFREVWPGRFQVVARDCTIRYLYVAAAEHAFKYLWENRLRQEEAQLAHFGRQVLGGGLRFVMPPDPSAEDVPGIEVKIESFLEDSTRIYVDVVFQWPTPASPDSPLEPEQMLREVNEFATEKVVDFITGGD